MKVLHVIDRLETGGAEKLFVSMTKMLTDKGVETGALLFNTGGALDKELDERVQLHTLNRKGKFNLLTLYKANRICKQYDIIHTHLRHVYAYIRLAQWLFGGKYKLVVHDHAAITGDIPQRYKGIFKPKYLIGVNKEQTDWAEQIVGVSSAHVYLLENTVLSTGYEYHKLSAISKVMMVANIRHVKNIEFAIRLCKRMQWSLGIYGNVIEHEYYNLLQKEIGDSDTIKIQEGLTDFTRIYPQYGLAIHCSPKETGPLVLIEYLSVGLPFVAYRTGSAAEAIARHLPQLFTDDFDTDSWQQRIQEILADDTLPEKMRQLYKGHFSPEQYINKCLEIYQNVHS